MRGLERRLEQAEKDLRGSAIRIAIILAITPFFDWLSYLERDLPYEPVAYLVPRAYVVVLVAMFLGAWSERIFHTRWPRWIRGTCFGLAIVGVVGFSSFGMRWVDSVLIGHPMRGLGVIGLAGSGVGAGFMSFKRKRDGLSREIYHP